MRHVAAACGLLVGVAAVAYAVTLFLSGPRAIEPGTVVVEGADIGDTAVDTVTPTRIRIRNDSDVAIRFVGGPYGCQPGGCLRTTGECPLTIPARTTAEVTLSVSLSATGPFQLTVPVYLDLAGTGVERTVYLTGTGVQTADNLLPPDYP